MSAKPATQTADLAFETHRVELHSHRGSALAVASPTASIQPQDRGAAAQSKDSEAILLRSRW